MTAMNRNPDSWPIKQKAARAFGIVLIALLAVCWLMPAVPTAPRKTHCVVEYDPASSAVSGWKPENQAHRTGGPMGFYLKSESLRQLIRLIQNGAHEPRTSNSRPLSTTRRAMSLAATALKPVPRTIQTAVADAGAV